MIALVNPNENTPKPLIKGMPITPYGTIPKRSKSKANKKRNSISKKSSSAATVNSAPYPFFSSLKSPSSTSFLSFINNLFGSDQQCKEVGTPVGFMPCNTHHASKTQMSQLDIIVPVPVSNPIDCYYSDRGNDTTCHDNCSSFSTSSSSSNSDSSLFSMYMDDDVRDQVRNGLTNDSCMSTTALSDILCDHYVQTQMNTPSSSDDFIDVPLETFRIFEAPPQSSCASYSSSADGNQNWMIGSLLLDEPPREWTLVETLSKQPKRLQPRLQSQQSQKQQEKEQPGEEQKPEEQVKVEEQQKDIVIMNRYYHDRDTRANAAYLRMIVAEVNMMRSQKIVGPLRPRRVLPKRLDRFMHRPSPLQLILV
ncbi:hypothetical protein MUCCIDRAFT_114325 [Mucor lusitanicus CBS 277.49]|uniref:Uncharacterized protein n=2 Tax=Mucor circinelloides f. lusitanicus TaxID=29924 RepID=A0A168HSZ1_MUCCL|nr:hypothetical protein MUCCIDRAFT_114325 [Mucor lusitanicus CBS 277.49]